MEIRQLLHFIQICDDLSISKAASRFNITQQALSKSIKTLEDELDIKLFIRNKRGIQLTHLARSMQDGVRGLVNRYHYLLEHMQTCANLQKGTIFMGIPPGIVAYFVPQYVVSFKKIYPDILLTILEEADLICESKLVSGFLDMACGIAPIKSKELEFLPFVTMKSYLLVHKENPLSQKTSVRFRDLKKENFVLVGPEFTRHHTEISKCRNAGFEPNIVYMSSLIEVRAAFVQKNLGIAFMPESLAMNYRKGPIVTVPVDDSEDFDWTAGLMYRKNGYCKPIVNTLIEYVRSGKLL